MITMQRGRSREGAWIEIQEYMMNVVMPAVAPVRERGLKSHCRIKPLLNLTVAPVRERGLK